MNQYDKQWECPHSNIRTEELELDQAPEQRSLQVVTLLICKDCDAELDEL